MLFLASMVVALLVVLFGILTKWLADLLPKGTWLHRGIIGIHGKTLLSPAKIVEYANAWVSVVIFVLLIVVT